MSIWTNVKIFFVKDKNSDSKVQLKESHDVDVTLLKVHVSVQQPVSAIVEVELHDHLVFFTLPAPVYTISGSPSV